MILAGIDIGANAARLLIADITNNELRTVHAAREVTRLGRDLDRTGMLAPGPQDRTLEALLRFRAAIARYPVARTRAVGTSALRRAANAAEFVRRVRERTGLELSIISGIDEARLTLSGVRSGLAAAGSGDLLADALVADIGGGSTELILTRSGRIASEESLELGAVYLTERFLRSDPPLPQEIDGLRAAVAGELGRWEARLRAAGLELKAPETLAATAGTAATLAAMAQGLTRHDPDRINGYRLRDAALDSIIDLLGRTASADRLRLPGLDQGREDIILAGALITRALMERCRCREMLVSDRGLREGILFDLLEERGGSGG